MPEVGQKAGAARAGRASMRVRVLFAFMLVAMLGRGHRVAASLMAERLEQTPLGGGSEAASGARSSSR